MQWITGLGSIKRHSKSQPKRDLLAMTEAEREALTKQVKEYLEQRVKAQKSIDQSLIHYATNL